MTQASLDLPPVEVDEATLLDQLAALQDMTEAHSWPARLLELADVFEAAFIAAQKLKNITPRNVAEIMVLALARNQGGRPVYLPAGESVNDALRARRVWRDRGPLSINQLAEREGVVVQTIYRDIARIEAIEKARRQPTLI
jgi:Mor family transcriptional regulator